MVDRPVGGDAIDIRGFTPVCAAVVALPRPPTPRPAPGPREATPIKELDGELASMETAIARATEIAAGDEAGAVEIAAQVAAPGL